MVKAIPDGFNSVNCGFVTPNAAEAVEFYRKAFGAETILCIPGPGGAGVMHAEMRIGNSTIMIADETPNCGLKSAQTLGGAAVSLHLYVEDADAMFKQAVEAGCTVEMPLQDMFWGDRYGKVLDPFGISWGIATHKEDVSHEELQRRAAAMFEKMGAAAS